MTRQALFGVLLGAVLLASACRRAEETRSLNFDPETTAGALGAGWDAFEKTETGDTFAWAHAKEARVVVRSDGGGDRLVRFRCWPFTYPGGPPQTVTLLVNDRRIDAVTLGSEARVYTLATPGSAWKNGVNELTFAFAFAESPRDRLSGATDDRTLAAAFDWLEILPAVPAAAPVR